MNELLQALIYIAIYGFVWGMIMTFIFTRLKSLEANHEAKLQDNEERFVRPIYKRLWWSIVVVSVLQLICSIAFILLTVLM